MDREAIKRAVEEWIESLVQHDPDLAWLKDAELVAYPAFLVDEQTKEGDDYKAGALSIGVSTDAPPIPAAVDKLHDAVVADPALGDRVKRATFERTTSQHEAGTIVVVPR